MNPRHGVGQGRVGIVTILDNQNHGNRLQNLALQAVIESLGFSVVTLRNTPAPMKRSFLVRRALSAVRRQGMGPVVTRNAARLASRDRAPAPSPHPSLALRAEAIDAFTRSHIVLADVPRPQQVGSFQRFVVGSDQVWNHGFRNANEIDFLTFAEPPQRVAYAASFGLSELPAWLHAFYRERLMGIPWISVREARGAEMVRELIGRKVPVVLDPTLLHSADWWSDQAEPLEVLRRPYVVRFFLGTPTEAQEAAVQALADERGWEVVDLLDPDRPECFAISPLQFLDAIRNAEMVLTDSFHAAVFSTLFHRPLVLKERELMGSRLDTLLDLTGRSRTPWRAPGMSEVGGAPWSEVDERLHRASEESLIWLRRALGVAGDDRG